MKQLLAAFLLLAFGAQAIMAQFFLPVASRKYCVLTNGNKECCNGRQDECAHPYLDTTCYCDQFCQRGSNSDCCPDYENVCLGIAPQPQPQLRCYLNGKYYDKDASVHFNCNKCSCKVLSPTKAEMVCEEKTCLIRPETIDRINNGNYGWKASNYSFLWGKSLEEGYQQRAGICKPDPPQTSVQNSIKEHLDGRLEEEFDARHKWPRMIRHVTDQLDYPASWAISTVDVAADRLAIQSNGEEQVVLSAQNLISCINPRKNACATASTDRAWWYLGTFGVVSEACYPYRSGYRGEKRSCEVTRDTYSDVSKCSSDGELREAMIYRAPPAYRVNSKEEDIMAEIKTNGPVQALLHVRSDFFSYKSGVYRHVMNGGEHQLNQHAHRYHAVRIIGWGVDTTFGQRTPYWLCANSWGTEWGENGYFRILRGSDESQIEMFIVGVWARKTNNKHTNEFPNHI